MKPVFPKVAAKLAGCLAMLSTGAAYGENPPMTNAAAPHPLPFTSCTACHSTEPGKMKFGPSLHGVSGRPAASLPGYSYSEALKQSGITWNAETLDKWLTSPKKAVPGTKMPFPGIPDRDKRRQVIEFLLTLK